MFANQIIDSQEKSKDNVSALYLNNKKIQGAKNNQTAVKCFELFSDFLEQHKLANTSEVFASEADYKKNTEVRRQLAQTLEAKPDTLLLKTLIQKTKTAKPVPPKEEPKNFKLQMDDFQAKSAKFDQLLEMRRKTEDQKPVPVEPLKIVPNKASETAKFANILEDSQKFEARKLKLEESPVLEKAGRFAVKPNPAKLTKEDSASDFSLSGKKALPGKHAKLHMNFVNPTLKEKGSVAVDRLGLSKGINKTSSNSESNEFALQDDRFLDSQKKENSLLQNENEEMVTVSHGVDNTVDSDVLEEYDYIESIERF